MAETTDRYLLRRYVATTIGDDSAAWDAPAKGWAGDIEVAFLNALPSVPAIYGNSPSTGLRLRQKKWQIYRGSPNLMISVSSQTG